MAAGSVALVWLLIVIWNCSSGWIMLFSYMALFVSLFGMAAARDHKHEFGPIGVLPTSPKE